MSAMMTLQQAAAWLGSAPKPRTGKTPKPDPESEPLTRLQRMAIDDLTPDFPPIRTPWVIDWLMEVGPTDPGAMGAVPTATWPVSDGGWGGRRKKEADEAG